jgi:hypothetical protein
MRTSCERCDRPLPLHALNARICTFECTFCAACADDELGGTCPNCTGELVARPTRPDGDRHAGVVLRRYVDAWRDQDLDALLGCYGPGFTLHYGGASRFAGTHVGRDAALAVMAEVSTVAPRELLSVDEVLVSDRGGALVVTERLRRDGEVVDVRRVLRYRVEDDLLAECWLLESDQAVVDHLWR